MKADIYQALSLMEQRLHVRFLGAIEAQREKRLLKRMNLKAAQPCQADAVMNMVTLPGACS